MSNMSAHLRFVSISLSRVSCFSHHTDRHELLFISFKNEEIADCTEAYETVAENGTNKIEYCFKALDEGSFKCLSLSESEFFLYVTMIFIITMSILAIIDLHPLLCSELLHVVLADVISM